MKIKKVVFIIIILALLGINNSIYANTMQFYDNGNISQINVDGYRVSYDEDGKLSMITGNGTISLSDGLLSMISVPNGTVFFDNGNISSVVGNYTDILDDVQYILEDANDKIIAYVSGINIKVPGASNPSESATVITNSLNSIIDTLNQYSGSNTTSNQNVSANNNQINISGTSIEANSNGVLINGNTETANNISVMGNENDASIDIPGVYISGNENNISMNLGGLSINANENGQKVSAGVNPIHLYIIIGVIFLVLFVVIVFGFIIIKKQKGQIVTKNNND